MTLRTELLTAPDRLEDVGPAWGRLWQRAGGSPFQGHGWITAWWKGRDPAAGLRLHIGLCWDGDELAAVIPCATRRHRGVRVLEWAAKDCSDYCDAITDGDRMALLRTWQAMTGGGGFQVAYLSHVRPDAAFRLLADGGSDRGLGSAVVLRPSARTDQALQVRSHGLTGAEWFRTLSKKARNNHTRGKRIVAEAGRLSVSVGDGSAEPAKLERMIELKQRWLVSSGRRNRLFDHDARALRQLVAYLRASGAMQLFSLDCDGRLVAGLVSIVDKGRVAAFFAAFDPRFDRASPGTLVIVEQLMWAFDRGFAEVDFLCGDEPYKSRFADARTELAAYVGARTLLGRAAVTADEWLLRLRPKPAG